MMPWIGLWQKFSLFLIRKGKITEKDKGSFLVNAGMNPYHFSSDPTPLVAVHRNTEYLRVSVSSAICYRKTYLSKTEKGLAFPFFIKGDFLVLSLLPSFLFSLSFILEIERQMSKENSLSNNKFMDFSHYSMFNEQEHTVFT